MIYKVMLLISFLFITIGIALANDTLSARFCLEGAAVFIYWIFYKLGEGYNAI